LAKSLVKHEEPLSTITIYTRRYKICTMRFLHTDFAIRIILFARPSNHGDCISTEIALAQDCTSCDMLKILSAFYAN